MLWVIRKQGEWRRRSGKEHLAILHIQSSVGLHATGDVEGRVPVALSHPGVSLVLTRMITGFYSSVELARHFLGLQHTFAEAVCLHEL